MVDKKSFTLIELLIVLVIIGILTTVALPQYQKMMSKTRTAEAKSVLNEWCKLTSVYRQANNKFPFEVGTSNVVDQDLFLAEIGATVPPSKYWNYDQPRITPSVGPGTVENDQVWIGNAGGSADPNEMMCAFLCEDKIDPKHEFQMRVRKDGKVYTRETWDDYATSVWEEYHPQ